ncbi:MAG: carbohydrate binding family 9 domain-containing protein [Gemmatimonadaceae bacterium]|nr:carbohydrate binding family 9 domain-containing protein [Gemmatimonadaceae bacterium]
MIGRRAAAWMLVALLVPAAAVAQAVATAADTARRPRLRAVRASAVVRVDGRLDDDAWRDAPVATGFRTVEPTEGRPSAFETRVRVVFDDVALYVAFDVRDPLGPAGVRVQDLRRKFDYFENDLVGVSFDALHDGRTVAAFQVTPYGAQRELQVFDDVTVNREWEAVWRTRAAISDSGWTAELAIPWSTLRYRLDGVPWNVNFYRIARRANETSAWSPWPRAFSAYRVPYFGALEGLVPPPPRGQGGGLGALASAVRWRPFVLGDARGGAVPAGTAGRALQVGGEATWTPTANTTVDLTVNTDFAQAEVDRQVVNTTRFGVFFPERRQFFLEGASLFDVGPDASFNSIALKPFFSRRIGLDAAGQVVPIQAGVRAVRRDARGGDGLLVIRQDATEAAGAERGATTFGVLRTSRNVGATGRLGVLATGRQSVATTDATGAVRGATGDGTVTVDGFAYLSPSVTASAFASVSSPHDGRGTGTAAYVQLRQSSRTIGSTLDASLVTREYDPSLGFVARRDILRTAGLVSYNWRPRWLPRSIRYLLPYASTAVYTGASDRRLQETFSEAFVDIFFQNGAIVYPDVQHFYQRLDVPFSPVRGVTVRPGQYQYGRGVLYIASNQSARVAGTVQGSTGGWFDRTLDELSLRGRVALSPRAVASVRWDINRFREAPADSLGRAVPTVVTHLVAPELRLALNPRVQLSTFYQYNTDAARGALNARFSWEFAPLSYVYLVVNDQRAAGPDARIAGPPRPAQQVVLKVVWATGG